MNLKVRSTVSVISGLFAGAFDSMEIPWHLIPKALLTAGVAALVAGIFLIVLPKSRKDKEK